MPEISEHLRGPWQAVLAEEDGTVYSTVEEAIDALGRDGEVEIGVVRGTALPSDGQLPGTADAGDVAYQVDAWLVDEEDGSLGGHARFEQAKAMAAGLNAAWRANEPGA